MADIANIRIAIEDVVKGVSELVKALETAERAMQSLEKVGTQSASALASQWRSLRAEIEAATQAAGSFEKASSGKTRASRPRASSPPPDIEAYNVSPEIQAVRDKFIEILTGRQKDAAAAAAQMAAANEAAAKAEAKLGENAQKAAASLERKAEAVKKESRARREQKELEGMLIEAALGENLPGDGGRGDGAKTELADLGKILENIQKQALLVFRSFILWTTLRTAVRIIKEYTERFAELEAVMTRVAFAAEKSADQVRASLASQSIVAARYGVSHADIAPAALFMAQTGIDSGTRAVAAEIARVFGPRQYANILEEVYQTQRRAANAGLEHVEILDYLATAFREVPVGVKLAGRELEVYFDALQYGIELAPKFGLSVEKSALVIARSAAVSERGVQMMATSYSALTEKIARDPATREYLGRLGIQYETTAEGVRKVVDAFQALQAVGDDEGVIRLLSAILGGTLQSPARLNEARVLLMALSEFEASSESLASFEKLSEGVANTFKQAFTEIQSSWDALLTAMALAFESSGVGKLIMGWLRGQAGWMRSIATGMSGRSAVEQFAARGELDQLVADFKRQTGLDISVRPGLNGLMIVPQPTAAQAREAFERGTVGGQPVGMTTRLGPEMLATYLTGTAAPFRESAGEYITRRFYEFALEKAEGEGKEPPAGPAVPPGGGLIQTEPPPEVERLLRLPEGIGLNRFIEVYQQELRKLEAIPDYFKDEERTLIAMMDAQNQYIRTQSLNSQAASEALRLLEEEARRAADAMSMFGGLETLPEGVTFEQFEAEVRRQEARIREQIPEEYSRELLRQKDFFFDDDGRFRKLLASSEAIRLATQELVKIEKSKITGVFNVPDEGRALVPFFALQRGFVPRGMEGQAEPRVEIGEIIDVTPINSSLSTTATSVSGLGSAANDAASALSRLTLLPTLGDLKPWDWRSLTHSGPPAGVRYLQDNPEVRLARAWSAGHLPGPGGREDIVVNVTLDGNVVQRVVHSRAYTNLSMARRSSSSAAGGGRVHMVR